MSPDPCETYRRNLRWWGVATLVEAAVLLFGLAAIELLDADLSSRGFTVALYLSLFVLVPLMVSTPVSLLVTVVYALRYRARCRR